MTGMPWFRLDRDVATNPKLFELEGLVGDAALAYLIRFWCAVAAHRSDGDVSGVSDAVLERWAGWLGARGELVAALRTCGFLEGSTVKGWAERQGAIAAKFARDNARPNAAARDPARGPALDSTGQNRTGQNEEEEEERAQGLRTGPVRLPRTPRARTIVGLSEEATRPKTVEELAELYRVELRQRFPNLARKASVMRDALLALWVNYSENYRDHGREIARAKLFGWLEDAEAKAARKARAGGGTALVEGDDEPVERKRAREQYNRRKTKGEDLAPFDTWFATQDPATFSKASSRVGDLVPQVHPADVDGPAPSLTAMAAELTAKVRGRGS